MTDKQKFTSAELMQMDEYVELVMNMIKIKANEMEDCRDLLEEGLNVVHLMRTKLNFPV